MLHLQVKFNKPFYECRGILDFVARLDHPGARSAPTSFGPSTYCEGFVAGGCMDGGSMLSSMARIAHGVLGLCKPAVSFQSSRHASQRMSGKFFIWTCVLYIYIP